MKISLLILLCITYMQAIAQNIGIGTETPEATALLHIELGGDLTKGFLVRGNVDNPAATVPDLGGGSRMMFYPGKAAFRAGYVSSSAWNNVNTGLISIGLGYNAKASGDVSVAIGNDCVASGVYSTAIGGSSIASGGGATAIGAGTSATNTWAMAMGYSTTASGYASNAMGYVTTASGDHSTTMGNFVSTTGFDGAFAIGDNSTTTVMQSFVDNGFRSRFAGGYRLLTNSAANIGVVLLASGNSWSAISDVNMKEKFMPVDGESILQKIALMPLTTWNYKGQDEKTLRHYGPMAQDFYKAFGHDALGEIGCDTLINQQDFLGVDLIAIQALEKRTEELQKQNEALTATLEKMQYQINQLMVLKEEKSTAEIGSGPNK